MATESTNSTGPRLGSGPGPDLPGRTAPAEDVRAELSELDEELARQAEATIQTSTEDQSFDLEGEFLTQEEIAHIMAAEATVLAKASVPPPVAVQPAPTPEVSPAEPAKTPIGKNPITENPREKVTTAESSSEKERVQVPVAETPGEKVQPQEVPAAKTPLEKVPAVESPAPATAPDDADSVLTAAAARAADVLPQPAESAAGLAKWKLHVIHAATILDRPFARFPGTIKNVIGIAAGVFFLAGVAVWVVGSCLR